jgi:hypothetical protein
MSDLSNFFYIFKEKILLKITKLNQNPKENEVDTYGPPIFAPDNSTTGFAAKM